MMMSPEAFKEQCEKLSLEELKDEKNKLIEYIDRYEAGNISEEKMYTKPSPEMIYNMTLDYIKATDEIISHKTKDSK